MVQFRGFMVQFRGFQVHIWGYSAHFVWFSSDVFYSVFLRCCGAGLIHRGLTPGTRLMGERGFEDPGACIPKMNPILLW